MDGVEFVFSRTFEERLVHLPIVLEGMRHAGLTSHPGKVQLASHKIILLRFVVDSGTLYPNETKLRAVTEYPRPHDVKSLQRYLGTIAF